MVKHYEVLVIGGGTGGLRCSIIAAKSGYKTAVAEPGHLGGTCLNTGCIPTKTLLHSAHLYKIMKDSSEFGITAKPKLDFSKVMGRMRKIVATGRHHAEHSVDKIENLDVYKGHAVFLDKNKVKVGHEEISADKIIIATGARPWAPPIKGLEDTGYMTNKDALELKKQPKSLIMIGGGYICMELACFFASIGSRVIVMERMPRILGMLDDEISDFMKERMEALGIEVRNDIDILQVKGTNGKKVQIVTRKLGTEGPETVYRAQSIIVATGRRPNTEKLDLEKAGIKSERGYVTVNDTLQSSNPNIYAIGDVNGKSPFAHTAKAEAKAVLENALQDSKTKVKHDIIPWAAFTVPTIGGVGLSEKQAKEKKLDYGVLRADFSKIGKAKIIGDTEGFVKVVYDKKTRKLLGCTITGPDAHNLIHEFAVLMNTPSPKIDYLLETVHVHPTLSEIMMELREE